MTLALDSRIEINPNIKGGKPCIAGRRISVQNIVIWHERMGKSADEIATEHDLTLTEIYVALAFYYANRKAIDQAIRDDENFAEKMKKSTPSKLREKLRSLGNSH